MKDKDMDALTKDMQKCDDYEDLWKVFFHTIGIEERYNPKCQQTMMPKWYRKNAIEFDEK